jgi:hypothetical protein
VVVEGNSLLFLGAALLLMAGWWLYGLVQPDDRHTTRSVLCGMLEYERLARLLQVWR